jgi:orotidine-5'-phosphate decarboxylase
VAEPARPPTSVVGFGDRLAARVAERESQIVLGLDPDPMALWPEVYDLPAPELDDVAGRTATAVVRHCQLLIGAVAPACVAVKFQLACFERLGSSGWLALETLVEYAHSYGLLTIADGKRGDIDVSANAYAQALIGGAQTPLGPLPGLGADALTVNPLMGADAITPFVNVARATGAGVFVLVRTSNPGAADVEDLPVAAGGTVWERVASMVAGLGADNVGESGLSDVGAVVGATAPQHLARARELMPHAVFLLPGVGAQGGRVEDLAPAFAPGRGGGLITASRSIANAYLATDEDPDDAALAEAERLRELTWRFT